MQSGSTLIPPCIIVNQLDIGGRDYFIAADVVPVYEKDQKTGARRMSGHEKSGTYFLATMEEDGRNYTIICRFNPSNPNGA